MIFLKLFLTFFKIGICTFGGGYAMLPMIQQEVLNHGWLSQEDLLDFIAISESTPGPFAVNVSTYVGSETGGLLGAFCATFGVVLPSFVIILIVAKLYDRFKQSQLVSGSMVGLKPAVVGLIAAAVVSTAKSVFHFTASFDFINLEFCVAAVIFVLAIVALIKKVNPIMIIVGSAILGIVANYTVLQI